MGAFSVSWAAGVAVEGFDESGISAAAQLAAESDIAIVVVGDTAEGVGYDGGASCGEGADRPSLDLPGAQLDLLAAVIATGTPTVVVLVHGRPVTFGTDYGGSNTSKFTLGGAVAPLNERAAAVIAAWRPGCEGGNGLWDILTGAVSPSGRLAQNWPVSVGGAHLGGINPYFQKWCSEECGGFTLGTPYAPLYPFGFGLDYLQVSYGQSSAVVDATNLFVNLTVQVTNADQVRAGDKVVQVYFSQAVSRYVRYRRMLAGFVRVALPVDGSVSASVAVKWRDLSYWDPRAQVMVLEAGSYTFFVCHSSSSADCPSENTHTVVIPTTTTFP